MASMTTKNRSVPVDTVLPHITYQNLAEAIEWLTRVFDLKEYYRLGKQPSRQKHCHLGWYRSPP
jgi:hypothetical protein